MESVVLVRVTGPDATQKRAKRLPFSHSIYGKTTVSGSGIVFRLQEALYVVTTAHLLAPFRQSATDSSSITTPAGPRGQIKTSTPSSPLLLRDTVVDVLFDEQRKGTGTGSSEQWFASELVSILPIAEVTAAIDRLTGNDGATWTVGWSKITQADFGTGSEESDDQGREQWTKTFGGGFASGEANTKWANADEIALLRLNHESSNERRASSPARGIEWDLETAVAHRGQEVLVVGSPFGMLSPRTFMNAMGTGIVSNVMHHRHSKEPSLLLTDARCMPGQEGGAVLTTSKKLAGMLIPPIRRVDSRAAIDFNFAIPINLIERTILDFFRTKTKEEISPTPARGTSASLPFFDPVSSGYSLQDYQQHLAAVAEQSLVLVKIAANWASGVVVDVDEDDDTVWVLTNAHLFHPFLDDRPIDRSAPSDSKLSPSISTSRDLEPIPLKGQLYPIVRVCQPQSETTAPSFTWHRAEVVYVSSSHLDVALLMMKPKSPVSLIPIPRFRIQGTDSLSGITSGREVLVMGFPVFPPSSELAATCSKGVISKVIRVGTSPEPSIFLTSAAVHAGNSGGLLLDLATGSFLGLVTCNMKTKSGMMIPRLNYSISTSCLRPIFDYLGDERRNAEKLKEIDAFDEEFDAIWKLKRPSVTTSKPKPTTSAPNSSGELSTDPKGAMFRSFVGRVQQGQVPPTHPASSSAGSRLQSKL